MKIHNNYFKYLPSKKLSIIIVVCFVFLLSTFLLVRASAKEKFLAQNGLQAENGDISLDSLVQKDSDGDGIPDWEEALWGTDPHKAATFDGIPDAQYIAKKKVDLNLPPDVAGGDAGATETEKFAHQFFAAFTAFKASGQVDSQTINDFSSALGQSMADPTVIDQYLEKDVKVDETGDLTKRNDYYKAVEQAYENYQSAGIGDELNIVGNMLSTYSANGKADGGDKLTTIANAYKGFAKSIMGLSVPKELVPYHLAVTNDANNTGIAVQNMTKVVDDPVLGLTGLSQYQKYSQELVDAASNLEATFSGTANPATDVGSVNLNDIINSDTQNTASTN